ncbi:cytosine permease [Kibdelosporangium philippinense]|uniref:Cytosine permease n=1 Tax=Kibdelosporangium philippinense TaxID=211113 RepID=A0ABS8Z7Z6_9PSEU|nr:cytosine permease [Kibdelosporangium philippinense]MCE7003617.1 cytosine permease [Kibdelosporangium philippinense]
MSTAPSAVERNGINPVPDTERRGRPRELFAIWFSWNVSILGIGYGIYVFGLGLSVWQAILAGTLGYVGSALLVGVLSVGGPRTGLPTLTQTRFAFGLQGNKFPAVFAYITSVGWNIIIIAVAWTTGAALLGRLWPNAFVAEGGGVSSGAVVIWFVVVLAVTLLVAMIGHQLIVKVESWIAWLTAVMTVVFIVLIVPHIRWEAVGSVPDGSWVRFLGGVILAMTMVGLGFLTYGGDFARYLPRAVPARGVITWTTAGIALPVTALLVLGVLLAAGNSDLGTAAASDPIGALTALLPLWFLIPFSIVVVISLVAAAITSVYSSGLALLALGMPLSRIGTTALNTIVISAGAFYLLFVSDSFLATFQAFLALVSVLTGAMGSIQLVDFVRQRWLDWDVTMALPSSAGGRDVRWTAIVSLGLAAFVGLGTVTSADPNIATVVGFLLGSEAEKGVVGQANLGVVLAMLVAAAVYACLTFVFEVDNKTVTDD